MGFAVISAERAFISMPELYHLLTGKQITTIDEVRHEYLVEGMLHKRDYVMMSAEEKIGKTIFVQQLCCSLSSGTPFLNTFDIPKPQKVWIFATEGRVDDLQDRFIRMSKSVPTDFDNIHLIPTLFRFNTDDGIKVLEEICNKIGHSPDLIIIDPLYRAVIGSLKDDNVVNEFHHVMGILMDQLDCAIWFNNHFKKAMKDEHGKTFQRTDKDSFGSAFLPAGVDHHFWLDRLKKEDSPNDRVLSCDTQRSGNIVSNIRIRMDQDNGGLMFNVISSHEKEKTKVLDSLKQNVNGLSVDDLMFYTRIGRTVLYSALKELANESRIEKYGTKTKYYRILA